MEQFLAIIAGKCRMYRSSPFSDTHAFEKAEAGFLELRRQIILIIGFVIVSLAAVAPAWADRFCGEGFDQYERSHSSLGAAVLCLRVLEGQQVIAYSEGTTEGRTFRAIGYGRPPKTGLLGRDPIDRRFHLQMRWMTISGNGEQMEYIISNDYMTDGFEWDPSTGGPKMLGEYNSTWTSMWAKVGDYGQGKYQGVQPASYVSNLPPLHNCGRHFQTWYVQQRTDDKRCVMWNYDNQDRIGVWLGFGEMEHSRYVRLGGGAEVDIFRGSYIYGAAAFCWSGSKCDSVPIGQLALEITRDNAGHPSIIHVSRPWNETWATSVPAVVAKLVPTADATSAQLQKKAEIAVTEFQLWRSERNFAQIYSRFDAKLASTQSKEKFISSATETVQQLGDLRTTHLGEAKVVLGNPSLVRMVYNSVFEKDKAQEWFTWYIYGDDVRLADYRMTLGWKN